MVDVDVGLTVDLLAGSLEVDVTRHMVIEFRRAPFLGLFVGRVRRVCCAVGVD